ncbi:MAG: hypothetical protein V1494_06195 [Candidatus Diapherotrites archaeon]
MPMQDFDRFDSPSYGSGVEIVEETPLGRAMEVGEQGKKFLPLIVLVIVIAAIGWFAFDFFVGSYHDVSFTVNDTEGDSIGGWTVQVSGEDGMPIKELKAGDSIKLKQGSYSYDAGAPGYKAVSGALSVGSEGTKETVVLEKNVSLELSLDFPATLYTGQTKEIDVSLSNKESGEEAIEIVAGGDLASIVSSLELQAGGTRLSSIPPGITDAKIVLKVKDDVSKDKIKEGLSAELRVKGLNNKNAKASAKFELVKLDLSKIKLSLSNLSFGAVSAGKTVTKIIDVTNSTGSEIDGISVGLSISTAGDNDPATAEQWFEISPTTIDSLPSGSSGKTVVTVIFRPPVSAQADSIAGTVNFSNDFWSSKINLVSTSVKATEIKFSVSGVQKSYSIKKDSGTGLYTTELEQVTVKNSSDVPVSLITINAECNGTISNWISINPDLFQSLDAGDDQLINMQINVPNTEPAESIKYCFFRLDYADPASGSQVNAFEQQFVVQTSG